MVRYLIPDFPIFKVSTSILFCTHTPTVRWSYEPTSSSDPRLRRLGR
jgi:hypothetical protein